MDVHELLKGERWAMHPPNLEALAGLDLESLAARPAQPLKGTRTAEVRDNVAIVPIIGPILRRDTLLTQMLGSLFNLTTLDRLSLDLRTALDNPAVSRIVLEVDSPGGMVSGISEMAAMIREGTARKPITAYVGDLAASAGYWLASAAGEIVVANTARLGSIGVAGSVRLKQDPNRYEIVSSNAPNKRPDPNTEAGRAQLQAEVDVLAEIFVRAVASYRDTTPQTVEQDFGRGGLLVGADAVALGMADRLGSFEGLFKPQTPAPGLPRATRTDTVTSQRGDTTMSRYIDPVSQDNVEADARRAWERDPDLRAEFGGDLNRWIAYRQAEARGHARILGKGADHGRA